MMIRNRISLFVATFLIIGFFFLALPEKGYSGTNGLSQLGCCVDNVEICIGCGSLGCAINESECGEIGGEGLSRGDVCFNNGFCLPPKDDDLGCCVISAGTCNGGELFVDCDAVGIAWFFDTDCSEVPQCAPVATNVPTLSGWGLLSLAVVLGILGIAGFMVMRRKKVAA